MRCPSCGSTHFRLSRLRFSDLLHLLILRYPVRCRLCRERSHVSFAKALHARKSGHRAHTKDSEVKSVHEPVP
jgi:hypothetical protein